jgi:hypothetical protein
LRKTLDKFKLKDSLQSICPLLLKTVLVRKNRERLKNYHKPKKSKEESGMTDEFNMAWMLPLERTSAEKQVESK